MAVLANMSNVDLHGSMVLGGDETVCRRTNSQSSTSSYKARRSVPFAGDVEVDNFSLIVFHDGSLVTRLSKLTPELKMRV